MFDELINQELDISEMETSDIFEGYLLEAYEGDMESLAEDLGESLEEATEFFESIKRSVSSSGKITRRKSKAYRSRRATLTTGMSKSKLKQRARKAAKTKKRSPSSMKKAIKKRNKALKIRKRIGL